MSHFSVLVITDERPTEDVLHNVLLPWHEYECTGYKEFCEWVDHTEEVREDWPAHKNGYDSIKEFAEDYHGCSCAPGSNKRFGRFTNLNAKWDWWQVGGRWSGMLKAIPGADTMKGDPGLMGSQVDCNGIDQCRIGDLDRQAMIHDYKALNIGCWNEAEIEYAKSPITTVSLEDALGLYEDEIAKCKLKRKDGERLADVIGADKRASELRSSVRPSMTHLYGFLGDIPKDHSRETYINDPDYLSAYAIVKDGEWHQRGEMGWFGMSSNDKGKTSWMGEFNGLVDGLDDDQWISVVDCHI